jgi:MATE family multidrug resistance protein
LLVLAIPMIVSQAADTVMLFVDRLFLSVLGKEHLAACMVGGLTSFMVMTLFIGLINYVNPLTAQYLGAGRKAQCSVAGVQAVIVALLSTPLVLALIPAGRWLFVQVGHDPLQTRLESEYFTILALGSVFPLLRTAISGFFCGIGRTGIVMIGNIAAMLVNVAANYILIYGRWGAPALGIRGAAYGTLLGSAVGLLVLLGFYWSPAIHREFDTRRPFRWSAEVLGRLLRFGMPSGVEFLLNMTAFNLFVLLFHSYGSDAAAAITITFNWDLVSFLPLVGVHIAVTSLAGRFMGAGQPDLAARTAWSGIKITSTYALLMTSLFVFQTHALVSVFTTGGAPGEYDQVIPLAVATLRIAALYLLGDGLILVFSGVLRGAGDTRWTMIVTVILHWCLAGTSFVLIKVAQVPPLVAWAAFILLVFSIAIALGLRFRGGVWRTIQVIEPMPALILMAPENPAPPEVL